MQKLPLSPLQIAKLLDSIHNVSSSDEANNYYADSPRHIAAYNELIHLSKEELESNNSYGQSLFWPLIFGRRQNVSLFVAVAIEKGAFKEKFSHLSNWFINHQTTERTWEFYSFIGYLESLRKNALTQQEVIEHSFCYFQEIQTESKKELLHQFYKDYLSEKSAHQYIVDAIYQHPTSDLSNYLLEQCTQNSIDINAFNHFNRTLPKNNNNQFFIPSSDIKIILARFHAGFRFDEKTYRFQDDNLFTALLKTKNVNTIVNLLHTIRNFTITSEEEEVFNDLKKIHYRDGSLYDLVYPFYLEYKLNKDLASKETVRKRKL